MLYPDGVMVSAFRIYGLERWPHINQLVQQLCSQGLVSRFSEADYEAHGEDLEKYLATSAISARDKNVLMGLAWDLTSSSMAGRTNVFENVNGLPPSIMRHMLFFTFDRTPFAERIRRQVGLSDSGERSAATPTASDAWIASRSRAQTLRTA
jgi:aromatic ring hydroxylase